MDYDSIRKWQSAKPEKFQDAMIRDYLRCNRENDMCNNRKAEKIRIAQVLLLLGVALIPVILGILFHASISKAIYLDKPLL